MTLEQLNARAEGRLAGLVGLNVTEADPDRIRGVIEVREQLQTSNGFLHTATMIALLDTLAGYGALMHMHERAIGFTTIELNSSFLGTAKEGRVIGEATPVQCGGTTQVWQGRAWREADGKQLALFRCTQLVLYPPRVDAPKD